MEVIRDFRLTIAISLYRRGDHSIFRPLNGFLTSHFYSL
jgi:hypothetical protein